MSCIYGIGAPEEYARQIIFLRKGQTVERKKLLRNLIDIYFTQATMPIFTRGTFRARGDVVEVIPAYQYEEAVRIEFWGDEIERLSIIDSITGDVIQEVDSIPSIQLNILLPQEIKLTKQSFSIEEELKQLKYFLVARKIC